MKNILLLFILSCLSNNLFSQPNCQGGSSQIDLDINNISARLQNTGGLWWDFFDGKYLAPKPELTGGPSVSAIFAGGLWMGGYDSSGNLKLAAQTYGSGANTDYFPGPINQDDGTVDADACSNWDKHFPILKSEINAHIADFADNGTIDNPISNIMAWPAVGNNSFFTYNGFELPTTGQSLAPFFDINQDGLYNPELGEYPLISGDQAIWWVFNDIANTHTATNGAALGMEIQVMAYAYQCEELALDNATFYEFTFISRASETIDNFQVGLWVDFDLGCYLDDFVGFDLDRNMAYTYNQDDIDGSPGNNCNGVSTYGEEIPMVGVQLIEDTEDIGVSSFGVMLGETSATSSPNNAQGYMNYMEGKWADGTPFTEGGNGYGGTTTVNHLFTGSPADTDSWSMCNENIFNGDYRVIMSTGGNPIQPGQVKKATYAVVFTENIEHPCPDIEALQGVADDIADSPCTQSMVGTSDIKNEAEFEISPNPSSGDFRIISLDNNNLIEEFNLINLSGKVLQQSTINPTNEINIQKENLAPGVYFIKVKTSDGYFTTRKLIIQ